MDLNKICLIVNGIERRRFDIAKVLRRIKLRLNLRCASFGDPKKFDQLLVATTRISFRNVAGNTDCRTLNLILKAPIPCKITHPRQGIYRLDQFSALSPNIHVLKLLKNHLNPLNPLNPLNTLNTLNTLNPLNLLSHHEDAVGAARDLRAELGRRALQRGEDDARSLRVRRPRQPVD